MSETVQWVIVLGVFAVLAGAAVLALWFWRGYWRRHQAAEGGGER